MTTKSDQGDSSAETQLANSEVVHVFWTGGWDSTFRVLDLVIHYESTVQPVYVIDSYRKSSSNELAAMEQIKQALNHSFPEKAHHLLPLKIINRDHIEVSPTIANQYATLRSDFEIGWQYEWLSAVVDELGATRVELSLTGSSHDVMFRFLRENTKEITYPGGAKAFVVEPWKPTNEFEAAMQLFHRFAFPLLHIPKPEMLTIARAHGFGDLLSLTWFCHYPIGNQPCGACYVCRHVIRDGLGSRMPKSALLRHKVWFLVHPLRLLISNPERVVERVRDKLVWLRKK